MIVFKISEDCRCCENLFLEGILVVISVRSVGSRKKTSTRKFVLHTTTSSFKNKTNKKQRSFKYVKYFFSLLSLGSGSNMLFSKLNSTQFLWIHLNIARVEGIQYIQCVRYPIWFNSMFAFCQKKWFI